MTITRSVILRDGTTTEHASFTGVAGELTFDTTTGEVRIHDGVTVGGKILARLGAAGTFTTMLASADAEFEGDVDLKSGALSINIAAGSVPIDIDTNITSGEGNVDILKAKTVNNHYSGVNLIRGSSTSTGLGFYTTTSSTYAERGRFDASGNLLVGGTTAGDPSAATLYATGAGKFSTGSSGATASTSADQLVVEGSGAAGISILTADNQASIIYFGSPSDSSGGILSWAHDDAEFDVGTGVVGASTVLRADNFVTNLILSGASSSELATAAGSVSVTDFLRFPNKGELTIATGAVTVTGTHHFIDTESDAATDDLTDINGGTAGDIVILRAANNSRDPTLKDGSGNLRIAGDFTLTNSQDTILLLFDGSNWIELSRSDNT